MKIFKHLLTFVLVAAATNLFTMDLVEFDVNEDNGNPGSTPFASVNEQGLIRSTEGPVTKYSLRYKDTQGTHILSWHHDATTDDYWKTKKDLASGLRESSEAKIDASKQKPSELKEEFHNAEKRFKQDMGLINLINQATFNKPDLDELARQLEEYKI